VSYHRGRWSHGLVGICAQVVLVVIVVTVLFGQPAVAFLAEVIRVVGDALVALAQGVAR
jgi:hypothetical protein